MPQPISQAPADELIETAVAVWLACVRREADAAGYNQPIESSERLRRNIRMLLIGIEASGYAVVPLEPTEAMKQAAGYSGSDHSPAAEYRAMIAARPR